jgi:hypothetical protein
MGAISVANLSLVFSNGVTPFPTPTPAFLTEEKRNIPISVNDKFIQTTNPINAPKAKKTTTTFYNNTNYTIQPI